MATIPTPPEPLVPAVDEVGGPILPGHHPDQEQDKPSGSDFLAKMHALAQEEDETQPPREAEVLDLTPFEDPPASVTGERLAHLAGKPFELAGAVLGAVRSRLPD
jgi:hypothetical protein